METVNFEKFFTDDELKKLFPEDRSDKFFDALLGDPSEGAYDISLKFKQFSNNNLLFEIHLTKRADKCLVCNLTYGLPEVFSRHPVINIRGLVNEIDILIGRHAKCGKWQLGATREVSKSLHIIPLTIFLDSLSI